MKISQNKNQVFVKGLDNVDTAMLSTVKKYFERNPDELYASIDYIILSILKTIKEELLNGELVLSVSSVNGKTGVVSLIPGDIGAEPSIDKLTAFNKDFGNEKGTVCEGDDPRLNNDRKPLEHEHASYLTSETVKTEIDKYLESLGITIDKEDGTVVVSNRNVIIQNGTITEV